MKNYDFMFSEHFLLRFLLLWTNFLSFLLCRSEVVASSNFYVQSSEKLCLEVKSAVINQNKFALKTFRSSWRPKKKTFGSLKPFVILCSWSFLLLPDKNRWNFCSPKKADIVDVNQVPNCCHNHNKTNSRFQPVEGTSKSYENLQFNFFKGEV